MAFPTHSEWGWLWRESRPFAVYQATTLICVVAASAVGLSQPLLLKWLIDDVLGNGRWDALAVATGLFLCASVGRSSLSFLASLVAVLGVERLTCRLRTRCVKHVLSRSAEFHGRHSVGDLLQRLETDVAIIGQLGSDVLPAIARVAVETVLALALMIYLDWRLAAAVLPVLPLLAYVSVRYLAILRRHAETARAATGHQTSLLHEMLTGATQIQLLAAEHRVMRRYAHLSLTTMQRKIVQRKQELLFTLVSTSVIGLGLTLVVGYGGVRVMLGDLTVGGLVAFAGYMGAIFSPMNAAVGLYVPVIRVGASVRRLIDIEQAPEPIADAPSATPLSSPPQALACTNVSFGYGSDDRVLRRIDFHARAGERVVVVGESGTGKSSLLHLIPRLYDPTNGSVTIGGRDVRSVQLRSLRRAISFVPQNPILFQSTLHQNLRYGRPAATAEEIEHAAWISCLSEVVEHLPRGWQTELGPLGAGLSGGERQRVAIARALLQDRPILILDEATSALDSCTEQRLLSRLEDWTADRIVIVVSHRLAAARWAERVVVLRRGEIVEDGCHDALYRSDTLYRALWPHADAASTDKAEIQDLA